MRRLGALAGGIAAAAALVAAAPAAAAPAPYRAGAATVDTTPPAFDETQDLADFPEIDFGRGTICARSFYNGPRLWRFEEPYRDLDGSGDFNYPVSDPGSGGAPAPEPFCDYNHNGRWDGIYTSGDIGVQMSRVHDPIDARAIAIGDGTHTVVIVSVVAQGLHENYMDLARAQAKALRPGISDVVISANHNESSPDTVGIYGAPAEAGLTGANSGIDEYYYEFLEQKIAKASADAFDAMDPASLDETEFDVPSSVKVDLSTQFPTTDDGADQDARENGDDRPAAIDPKIRVLQAKDDQGEPIFTIMNLAAHNQEIGHDGPVPGDVSSDWPGYFHNKLEELEGGMAMFLVGDNGSMEDPETVPATPGDQYAKAQAVGERLADTVNNHLDDATPIAAGEVSSQRNVLFVPLENNAFKAAAAAGIFGQRQLYTAGQPSGRSGEDLKTSVAEVSVGPDLQFLANPGEAFPALMLGSPWGIDDPDGLHENVGCADRPNPPVPTWHSGAAHRFQVGLADDMIGYEIPPWAFTEVPGIFTNYPPMDDDCANGLPGSPNDGLDPAGHDHKLEAEGVGPSGSYDVAQSLTSLLDATSSDPAAEIRLGRFILADGTLVRRPYLPGRAAGQAVGLWVADPGSHSLSPGSGTIVGLGDVGGFGARPVDAHGSFMDFDGADQDGPDVSTRGMLVPDGNGGATARYYVDVYPSLDRSPLGASTVAGEPSASIDDVAVDEGNGAPTTAMLTVTLSEPTGRTVTVDYATNPVSAQPNADYFPTSGTLSFPPNDTSQTIGVQVIGDTEDEATEDLTVDLSNPDNATIADPQGILSIRDDDPPAGTGGDGGNGGGGNGGGSTGGATQPGASGVTVTQGSRRRCRKHKHGHKRRCRKRRH